MSSSPRVSSHGSDLTAEATTSKDFNNKVSELIKTAKDIFRLYSLIAKNGSFVVPRQLLAQNGQLRGGLTEDPKMGLKDVNALHTQFLRSLATLKADARELKKAGSRKKSSSGTRRRGEGFNNPKKYHGLLVDFIRSAREQFGQVDFNEINRVLAEGTDLEWRKRGILNMAPPQAPVVRQLNPTSNFLVDQLAITHEGEMGGVSSSSILTSLLCIYAAETNMQALAQPSDVDVLNRLKVKYLMKEAKNSQAFKNHRKQVRDANKDMNQNTPLPEVTQVGYANYLDRGFVTAVMQADPTSPNYEQQLDYFRQLGLMEDNVAPWMNKSFIGATQLMGEKLTDYVWEEMERRDRERAPAAVAKGKRDMLDVPISTANYFKFTSIPVITSILTLPKESLSDADKQLLDDPDVKARLNAEAELISAILEYMNSPLNPAGARKGRSQPGKHAKKRVDRYIVDQRAQAEQAGQGQRS